MSKLSPGGAGSKSHGFLMEKSVRLGSETATFEEEVRAGLDVGFIFEQGLVDRIKILDHVFPYTQINELIKKFGIKTVSPENMRAYIMYLTGTARLWLMSFEDLIPAFIQFKGNTEILTKMIFQCIDCEDSRLPLLQVCEKNPEMSHVVEILGLAGLIIPIYFKSFTGEFLQKLISATYLQIPSAEQIEMRIAFSNNYLTPVDCTPRNRWMNILLLASAEKIVEVIHLAQSADEITEAIHSSTVEDEIDLEVYGVLMGRLTEAEKRVLGQDLLNEYNYLCSSSRETYQKTERLFVILRMHEQHLSFTKEGFERMTLFVRKMEYAELVLDTLSNFLEKVPCPELIEHGDQALRNFITHHGMNDPLVAKYLHLAGDATLDRVTTNLDSTVPEIFVGKLTDYFERKPQWYLKLILLALEDDEKLCEALLWIRTSMTPRIKFENSTVIVDGRTFSSVGDQDFNETLPEAPKVLCEKCHEEFTEAHRPANSTFEHYVCQDCATEEDEVVTCPVCGYESHLIILRCLHPVCRQCFDKLDNGCPTCRGPEGNIREWRINDLVEDIFKY